MSLLFTYINCIYRKLYVFQKSLINILDDNYLSIYISIYICDDFNPYFENVFTANEALQRY